MTSRGKIRIYELSRDLNLDNKDLLQAANKLSISVKSHSSSISNEEAKQIKEFLAAKKSDYSSKKSKQQSSKEILSLQKSSTKSKQSPPSSDNKSENNSAKLVEKPAVPKKPLPKSIQSSRNKDSESKSEQIPKGKNVSSNNSNKTALKPISPIAPKPREINQPPLNKQIKTRDRNPPEQISQRSSNEKKKIEALKTEEKISNPL